MIPRMRPSGIIDAPVLLLVAAAAAATAMKREA